MQCRCSCLLHLIYFHIGPSEGHMNLIKQNICDGSSIPQTTNLHLHTQIYTHKHLTYYNNTWKPHLDVCSMKLFIYRYLITILIINHLNYLTISVSHYYTHLRVKYSTKQSCRTQKMLSECMFLLLYMYSKVIK